MTSFKALFCALALGGLVTAQYTATYDPNNLPDKTEQDQLGTNKCGTANSQTSLCQNVYVNSLDDFCVWGSPDPNGVIGNIEQHVVAYCSKPGRGTRLFPDGTLKNAHFVVTPDYVQVTGLGDFTKILIQAGDAGGEMDPHGPDGLGNPHGGLVFSNVFTGGTGLGQQIHEWTNFQSVDQFCIRACKPGPRAAEYCQHIYDIMGCVWNIPGRYDDGFESCSGDSVIPMGLYPQPDGSTSTYHQGAGPIPPAQNPAPTSKCQTLQSAQLYAGTTSAPTTTKGTTTTGTGGNPTSSAPTATGAASTRTPPFILGNTWMISSTVIISFMFGAFTLLL